MNSEACVMFTPRPSSIVVLSPIFMFPLRSRTLINVIFYEMFAITINSAVFPAPYTSLPFFIEERGVVPINISIKLIHTFYDGVCLQEL